MDLDSRDETSTTISDAAVIVAAVEYAISKQSYIVVTMPGLEQPFLSIFDMEVLSHMSNLRQAEHLLVAPLDPPIGNVKIRFSKGVSIQFSTDRDVVSIKTRFLDVLKSKTIRLAFPEQATFTPQKRRNARLRIQTGWNTELLVTRSSGFDFVAKIYDISRTGVAFYPVDHNTAPLEIGRIQLAIIDEQMPTITMTADVLGTKTIHGNPCYRCSFKLKTPADRLTVEHMIVNLETRMKHQRSEMFGPAEEYKT